MKKALFTLVLSGLLMGCCTMKHCECFGPELTIKFIGFSFNNIDEVTLIVTEKGQYSNIIDSVPLNVGYPCNGCGLEYRVAYLDSFRIGNRAMRDYSYLISAPSQNILDTINRIDFEKFQHTFECNECLIGRDLETCTAYKDYFVTFNGVRSTEGQTLAITK